MAASGGGDDSGGGDSGEESSEYFDPPIELGDIMPEQKKQYDKMRPPKYKGKAGRLGRPDDHGK